MCSRGREVYYYVPFPVSVIPNLYRSLVIEKLLQYTNSLVDPRIAVIHFYFDYNDEKNQKAGDLIRSLLKQMVYQLDSVPDDVVTAYRRASEKGREPNRRSFIELISTCARKFSKIFILIDAYDECVEGERGLLTEFFDLLEGGVNLFTYITTRVHLRNDLKDKFQRAIELEIRASDEDVTKYLTERLAEKHLNLDLKKKIVGMISDRAEGM